MSMLEVSVKTVIDVPAENVWSIIRDFGSIGKYVSAVENCTVDGEGIGAKRMLELKDGGEIIEKLEKVDDRNKVLTYKIVSGPLPVDNYVSEMKVNELTPHQSEITWSSSFVAKGASDEEAKETIEGIYNMGFEGIKKIL